MNGLILVKKLKNSVSPDEQSNLGSKTVKKKMLTLMNSLIWVQKLKNSVNPDENSNLGSKTEK